MQNTVYKYNCERCDFHCNEKLRWDGHINTGKHQTGKRAPNKNIKESYKCDKCEYITRNTIKFKEHKLNNHSNKEEREKEFKFYCKTCDRGYFYEDMYKRHEDIRKNRIYKYIKSKNNNIKIKDI